MNWLNKQWLALIIWWESLRDDDDDFGSGTPAASQASFGILLAQ